MAVSISDTIGIVMAGIFLLDIIFNALSLRSKKKEVQKAVAEVDSKSGLLVSAIHEEFKHLSETLEVSFQQYRLAVPRESTRCYAVLISKGNETRLLVQPAESTHEMMETVEKELGIGWSLNSSAFVDVVIPKSSESTSAKPATPKVEGLTSFTTSLEYVRDNFAEKPSQKKVIDAIISNVKKFYGRSHSGTA